MITCFPCYVVSLIEIQEVIMMCFISPILWVALTFFKGFLLDACVRAFQFCLPTIYIDGTFLTAKYNGQTPTTISMDDNNHMLSLAFTFVENGMDDNNHKLSLAFTFVENEKSDNWYSLQETTKYLSVKTDEFMNETDECSITLSVN
jgi:hypothetical protein